MERGQDGSELEMVETELAMVKVEDDSLVMTET